AHDHPVRERDLPARRRGALMEGAWARRPAAALARLAGRSLLLLSARDLLAAAEEEGVLLVALLAPAPAASAGFARAARDAGVALATTPESAPAARDAALVASNVCQLELGLEIVPLGGSGQLAADLVRQLKSRGAPPSALRLLEPDPAVAAELSPVAISSTDESAPERLV